MLMRSSWLAPKAGVGCARFFQIPNLHLVVCGVIHDRRGVRYRPSGPAPSLWLVSRWPSLFVLLDSTFCGSSLPVN
jgi:hypothetical protein